MLSFKFSAALALFLFSLCLSVSNGADPNYLYHYCPNTTTFSANSTYQDNLNLLLSSLSSNATGINSGFYNASAGRNPNTVRGLFLCRGDVSVQVCQDCVTFATQDVTQRCPVEKVAVIFYDECMLRYSNASIFSTLEQEPGIILYNTQNFTSGLDQFNLIFVTQVASLLNDTTTRATESASGAKNFAVKKENISVLQITTNQTFDFGTVYSLVQCTPDLSSVDCNVCLRGIIATLPNCCSEKQGARILTPSCNFRFELYPFYNESAVAVPSPPPVLPPRPAKGKGGISTPVIIAIVAPIGVSISLFIVGCCFLRRRAKKCSAVPDDNAGNDISTVEFLQFDLGTIEGATRKFSDDNKLGEGGFGEVYKGTLPNGQEIAVKRLSRSSGQGAAEFKNEVVVVAKLQHRNLVRLLGFCLEGKEKILVYEFVPNKSLDYFLYDPEKQAQLDWSKRYKIVGGIARGILYLHEESRLKIIHRDLKASNILLNADLNPKVSDFGIARIVGVDQTQASTNRIVGTYGYMAPEYAMHGQFSVKSDIYSFGVLVLEIISGKKNTSFYQTDGAEDLLSYAWKLWRDGTPMELLDPCLRDSYSRNEVIRCIQIGLLCVQEAPADRPTMATIVLMLNSFSVTLPMPPRPAFFPHSRTEPFKTKGLLSDQSAKESDQSTSKSKQWSVNEASITEVYPR